MSKFIEDFVSVVVPLYNEEKNLPELTGRLVSVLEQFQDYEIVFVNDGSTDQSETIIEKLCISNPSIKLISFTRNFGHQAAISAGLCHASGRGVAVIDGDLQDPPEVLTDFFRKWREGYDVVYGIRKKRKESLVKRSAYYLFYRLLNGISDINIPLDSGDFSVMDREVVNKINTLPERNRFVRGLRTWVGYRQIGLEFERGKRFAGAPKFTFRKLVTLAYDGLISFSRKPLIIANRLGILIVILSFSLMVYILLEKIIYGTGPEGWTSMIVVVLFLGGTQLLILGILGEYIGRVFDEVKGRPNYVVKQTKNLDLDIEKE